MGVVEVGALAYVKEFPLKLKDGLIVMRVSWVEEAVIHPCMLDGLANQVLKRNVLHVTK